MLLILHESTDGVYFYADKKYYWQPRVGVVHEMTMLQAGQAIQKKLTNMEEITEMLWKFSLTTEGKNHVKERGDGLSQDTETERQMQEAGVCEQNAGD